MPLPPMMGAPGPGPQGPPLGAGMPPMHPALAALQGARQSGAPDDGAQDNPLGTEKRTKEVFLDKDMFGDFKPKKGDKVTIQGTVTTTGVSVGVTPDSVSPEKGDKDEEKEFDPDLDDDLSDEMQTNSHPEPQQ